MLCWSIFIIPYPGVEQVQERVQEEVDRELADRPPTMADRPRSVQNNVTAPVPEMRYFWLQPSHSFRVGSVCGFFCCHHRSFSACAKGEQFSKNLLTMYEVIFAYLNCFLFNEICTYILHTYTHICN